MAINFSNALGIHEQALHARVKRAEVLANNLANADTPGYKARDVDFQAMMARAQGEMQGVQMARTHQGHMDTSGGVEGDLMYRNPDQPSIDGNTVDSQQEQARFMRNAMDYQASFQFLNSKFTGLTKAIKGE
ncbi:flagellar basal body rod protein FlgB [Marinobacter zhejiangensis]|uniref:Flagellar basal body rod protein FlgB n=1 Tax=Marinobacter zhejiangensis TaxID=488535 RepID=A0A1I4P750_9GAMM|nr:flagellar basal body rod protein FlgB [Marinobacter zhejiangensis]SFM23628.1 flagellar basal-body rod protein FlgB [Marinobacter zhejiangensis]